MNNANITSPSRYPELRNGRIGSLRNIWYSCGVRKLIQKPLFLIILLAVFLRLFLLARVPLSLNWDEVSMGYSAYSISQTGMDEWGEKLPLFFRSYGEWKSAVYIYLLVPFIKIFGLNAWAVRLPSALAGILSVYLTYLIGKKLYGEKAGRWASVFLAVSPWALMLSRPAFEANVSLTLILSGIYFFLRSRESSKYYFLTSSAIAFGLAPHAYNSAKFVVPLLVIYLLFATKMFKQLKKTLIMLGILAIFALPILLNLSSGVAQARLNQVGITTDQKALGDFYALRATLPSPVAKLVVNKVSFTLYQTVNNWLSYFSPSFLLMSGGSHAQQSMPYHGVLYFSEFIVLVLGLLVMKKQKSPLKYLPVVLLILGFLPAAVTRDEAHVLRSILTLPGWQLLAGLGIVFLQSLKRSKLINAFYVLLVTEVVIFLAAYFSWYPRAYARDWQYGHKQVASYLSTYENEYDQIVMTKWFGEPQLFLAFYNRWDPSLYQQQNAANLRYESEGRMWLDQLPEYSLGKYTFKYLDWNLESQSKNTLYIGKFDDFGEGANILSTINYPDGTIAFVIASGTK